MIRVCAAVLLACLAPGPAFRPAEDYYFVPVRVHLLRIESGVGAGTRLSREDVERIFRKANGIWNPAGIHLRVESIVEERPAGLSGGGPAAVFAWDELLPLRPESSRAAGMFHVYFVGAMNVNGIYLGPEGIFVQENARLLVVPDGADEPLPRVTAHEIGHGLGLKHRQARTNLMASGTTGISLSEEEIHTVRRAAESLAWIRDGCRLVEEADELVRQGRSEAALSRYRALLEVPGRSPIQTRAQQALDAESGSPRKEPHRGGSAI